MVVLTAQYRVNMQLNTELYGHGTGSVRHSTMPWYRPTLPSDWQQSRFLSGALPSEIRGNYLLTGPLAPSGALAYIPNSARPYGSFSGSGRPRTMLSDRPLSVPSVLTPAPKLGSTRYVPAVGIRSGGYHGRERPILNFGRYGTLHLDSY